MITMDMLGKVRRLFHRDGWTKSEIARGTGLSRNTIKKWLSESSGQGPKYRRESGPGKLKAFEEAIRQALQADGKRPKRERRTAKKLLVEIQGQGYEGGYTILKDFIRDIREQSGSNAVGQAFVPLHFEFGDAFQFDWSEEGVEIGGVWRKVMLAHMKLCASGAFFLRAYPSQGHEMLFDAHTEGFRALGGIPRRGIYDNMKTAVDRVKSGKQRVVNARFLALCSHYLFDADFCNVASGWEKGLVEKDVQDSRRRIWVDTDKECFDSFDELNNWLLARCQGQWQELEHPKHEGVTVAEMLKREQAHLMPMVGAFDGYVEKPGRVSSTCLVSVERNHYSVPCEYAGKRISKRLYPQRIDILYQDRVVASHQRLFDRGRTRYDWQHYIKLTERKPGALRNGAPFAEMPKPLIDLQRLLLQREGGDRLMSQVLCAVPEVGLEMVLVSVQLVLESGAVSVEHVSNVISRLKEEPMPQHVETTLKLKEEPIADTGRYDKLRHKEVDHA